MEPALSSTVLKFPHFFPTSLQAKKAGFQNWLMIRLVPSFKLKTKYLYEEGTSSRESWSFIYVLLLTPTTKKGNKIKTLARSLWPSLPQKIEDCLSKKMSFSCHGATKKSFYDTVWPQLMLLGSHKYHIKPTGNVRVSWERVVVVSNIAFC